MPTEILADDHHTRGDLQLLKRSARSQWPVDEGIKQRAVEVTADLLESQRTSDVVAAVNALIQMDRANIAAERATAPTTQNNTQVNVYMPANSRESSRTDNRAASEPNGLERNAVEPALPDRAAVGQGLSCEIVQDTTLQPPPGH